MAFRRGMSMRPVNRIKHVVDSEGTAMDTTASDTVFVNVVNQNSLTFAPDEVLLGRKVNAFFITCFAIGDTGTGIAGSISWYLAKKHSGQTLASFPAPNAVGTSNVRNQIIHQEKGVPGSADGTPMVFKGVIAVPKGMRRMREGDQWFFRIQSSVTGSDANFCFRSIHNSFG